MNLIKTKFTKVSANVVLLILFVTVTTISCKEDPPEPTQAEINKGLMATTWVVSSVTDDTGDVTAAWSGFTLTVTENNYTSSNNVDYPDVWPSNGTWSLDANDAFLVKRSDGIDITIHKLDETTLNMEFDYIIPSGRLSSVEGNWKFNMVAQ